MMILLYRDKDWLYEHYIDKHMTSREMGILCNVSHNTILVWLKKYNILRRVAVVEMLKSWDVNGHPTAGTFLTDEHKKKLSEAMEGKSSNRLGKKCSDETRVKMSESAKKKRLSLEHRKHISAAGAGIDYDDWDGFKSFESYCPKFNFKKKEEIRNRDNRVCQMPECGKSEILNGERLSVHHIDGDKMQGCDEKRWVLVALCRKCHNQKFNVEKDLMLMARLSGLLWC